MVHFLGAVDLLNPKSASLKHLSLAARIRHSELVKVMLWDTEGNKQAEPMQICGTAHRYTSPGRKIRSRPTTAANRLKKRLGYCQHLILAVILRALDPMVIIYDARHR